MTTNQQDTKSNPNHKRNPSTKQHAIVNIQLNIVTWPMYLETFHTNETMLFYTVFTTLRRQRTYVNRK